MLKTIIQRINRLISDKLCKISKMAEPLAGAANIDEQVEKGSKRSPEDENDASPKRQRIEFVDGRRIPKRKIAVLIGYNGKNYYGVQINKGFRTIESDFFEALRETNCITQEHEEIPQKMNFQRACRTDKGVSAVCNVFSIKMIIDIDNLIEKLNSKLGPQIKIFGLIKTTKSFDSKRFCDNRTYEYICPTYAFAPCETVVTDEYRITDDVIQQINDVLKYFLGTHRFHNYTSQVKSTEDRAKRYIISFNCGKPFVRDRCEYCCFTIKGQSFMMHQIRKMIGLTIAIVRGSCGKDVIEKTWQHERVDVPKAPGLGLCLQQPHYDGYNRRFGDDGLHELINTSRFQEDIDKFKEEYIYSDIMKTEKQEKIMMEWLGTLQFHQFDFREDDDDEFNKRFKVRAFLDKAGKKPEIVVTPETKKARRHSQSDCSDTEVQKDTEIKSKDQIEEQKDTKNKSEDKSESNQIDTEKQDIDPCLKQQSSS